VIIMCVMLAGMIAIWLDEPPRNPARGSYGHETATATPQGVSAAGVLCDALRKYPDLSPAMGTALVETGDGSVLLLSLAAEWGRTGAAGAREQLAVQCKREGL
jgi:hypothetical protein